MITMIIEVASILLALINIYTIIYPVFMSIGWIFGSLSNSNTVSNTVKFSQENQTDTTLILSMFNESDLIEQTLDAIQKIKYPNLKIVLVDDASTDDTVSLVQEHIKQNQEHNFQLIKMKNNGGKAKALNYALKNYVKTEFVVVVDADALIHPDAIKLLVRHFENSQIAAVTGKPIVRNRTTILGTLQSLEYVSIIDTIKRAQHFYFKKIMTVSGVIVMYRMSALKEVNYFDAQAMTEDIDITWRLYQAGHRVGYEPEALTYILVPEKIRGFMRQRIRWATGGSEVFEKNIKWVVEDSTMGDKFLLLEMFLSHLWSWSFIISTLDFLILVMTRHDFKLPFPIVLLFTLLMVLVMVISLHNDHNVSQLSWRDLLVWPIYYLFYWITNIICSITSEFKVLFGKNNTGKWVSPDRGI